MSNPNTIEQEAPQLSSTEQTKKIWKTVIVWGLNLIIAVLLVSSGYLYHDVIAQRLPQTQAQTQKEQTQQQAAQPVVEKKIEKEKLPQIPQVDVLNASTGKGIASRFTKYLRDNGYDVVEMKNFSYSHVPATKIIDRIGNLTQAKEIATILGVADINVLQQLNPDYMVDYSIVIGEDYSSLRPSRDTKK